MLSIKKTTPPNIHHLWKFGPCVLKKMEILHKGYVVQAARSDERFFLKINKNMNLTTTTAGGQSRKIPPNRRTNIL